MLTIHYQQLSSSDDVSLEFTPQVVTVVIGYRDTNRSVKADTAVVLGSQSWLSKARHIPVVNARCPFPSLIRSLARDSGAVQPEVPHD